MRHCSAFVALFLFILPVSALANEGAVLVRAQVREVLQERVERLPGFNVDTTIQELSATLASGEVVTVINDYVPLSEGDWFYTFPVDQVDGVEYRVHDVDRQQVLFWAVLLFVLVTVGVGGMVGARALFSLVVSIGLILYGLIPLLSSGYSPVLVSAVGAAVILALAMALTHGVTRLTLASYSAALVAVFVALGLGEVFVHAAHLSGFADSAATTVSLTHGALNMQGLLLGALIIGVLGIVDDLAVTQAVTVAELRRSGMSASRELYARAMRVGREHLGSVVNTLVLAYAGASLPLLILFSYAPAPTMLLINSEVIAVEIVRAAVGGVALALVIPMATYLAILAGVDRTGGAHAPHHHS